MKKLLCILLLIGLVGMTSVASAANWQLVGEIADGTVWFFDTQSLRKVNNTTYSVWERLELTEQEGREQAEEHRFKAPVSYVLAKEEYNFQNETSRITALTFYDKNGNVLGSENTPYAAWRAIAPGSVSETLFIVTFRYYQQGITSASSTNNDRWMIATKDDSIEICFDKTSIIVTSSTTYTILTRYHFTETGKKQFDGNSKLKDDLAYLVNKEEFDYSKNRMRILSVTAYDKYGNTLQTSTTQREWQNIYSDSLGGYVFNAIHDYYKKHINRGVT